MTNAVEHYSKLRYCLIAILAIVYLFSQLVSLSFASEFTGIAQNTLTWIENIGFGVLILIVIIGAWAFISAKNLGDGVMNALNDELTKAHIQSAAAFTFKFVFLLSFFLFVAAQKHPMSGEDTSRIVFTACLVVSYLRFAWLEIKHA